MVLRSSIPTCGMVLMAIPGDEAFEHVLSVDPIAGRDHTPYHTRLRPSRLLATITRFARFSGLSRLRHSAHLQLRNEPLLKLLPCRRFVLRAARYHRLPCGTTCLVLNEIGNFELLSASVCPDPSFLVVVQCSELLHGCALSFLQRYVWGRGSSCFRGVGHGRGVDGFR